MKSGYATHFTEKKAAIFIECSRTLSKKSHLLFHLLFFCICYELFFINHMNKTLLSILASESEFHPHLINF